MFNCDYCDIEISSGRTIHRGYDCTFCSKNCRDKVQQINLYCDRSLLNYRLWYKSKPIKIIIENTPKRTQSIINLQNKNFSQNINTESNYDKFNKIYKYITITISTMSMYISTSLYRYF